MPVTTIRPRPQQWRRFVLRHLAVTTITIALTGWSALSCAHNSNIGNYVYYDPGNRFAIDQPIVFQQGRNPVETGHNSIVGWSTHYIQVRSVVWSNAPRIPGRIAYIHGQPYSVFQLPGQSTIGYVIDVKDPGKSTWLPIHVQATDPANQPGRVTLFDTAVDRKGGLCCNFGVRVKLTFIKLDNQPFPAGIRTFVVPNLITLQAFNVSHPGKAPETPVSLGITMRVEGRQATCTLAGAATQHIQLPDVLLSAFPTVGSTFDGNQVAQFPLQCDPDITVFATLTDANNTANTSDTLTNTGSAQGVAVQLLQTSPSFSAANCAQGSPCRFGPDSSAKGNTNQWQVGPSHTDSAGSRNPSISFQARYVRTGTMQPGEVRAVSTITFSYQ